MLGSGIEAATPASGAGDGRGGGGVEVDVGAAGGACAMELLRGVSMLAFARDDVELDAASVAFARAAVVKGLLEARASGRSGGDGGDGALCSERRHGGRIANGKRRRTENLVAAARFLVAGVKRGGIDGREARRRRAGDGSFAAFEKVATEAGRELGVAASGGGLAMSTEGVEAAGWSRCALAAITG